MRSLHPLATFPYNLDLASQRSLSLLFVLKELLSFLDLLQSLVSEIPEKVSELDPHLNQLLLCSLNVPLAQRGGALDKLCFYCEILLKASKVGDEAILSILEEMQNAVMKVRSKLLLWNKKVPVSEIISTECKTLHRSLYQKLDSFFEALKMFLKESRTDENVLIYLIEHRKKFNQYFGVQSIETLLKNFFPTGPEELRATICEGYTRRGFSAFYSEQECLLDALEWEPSECQVPS
ncbi:MAG: hypothetical protein FJZ64_04720 [Chlamydiae bacterium]|nr:hypothetical protein [Chlamydiota bacterium]